MNYKSKKSIFHDNVINKEELSQDTNKKLKDSKYLILLLDVLMLCVNIFMLAYFVIKGFDIIAISILGLIVLLDCIHMILSIFFNHKFRSSIIFTSIYSLVLLILTACVYTMSYFIFDGVTIFENVGIAVSVGIRLVYFITTIATLILITKNKIKIAQPIIIIILAVSLLFGSVAFGAIRGVYGSGSGILEGNKTLEYKLREADEFYPETHYEVVGSLDSKYSNIIVPDEFNGQKVRAIDYEVLLTEGVTNINIDTKEAISVKNTEKEGVISNDLSINMPKDVIDQFKQNIYNNIDASNVNKIALANMVDPQLGEGEYAVKFNYDTTNYPEDLLNADGTYNYVKTFYGAEKSNTTLKSIFDANTDYKDYYTNNYETQDYQWSYDNKSQMAMILKSNLDSDDISKSTTINISFEDVYKVNYDFTHNENDNFIATRDDKTVKTDKYIIESDLSDIEFYEDIRFGCDVSWSVNSDGATTEVISNASEVLSFIQSNNISTEKEINMKATWNMRVPEGSNLSVDSNGIATDKITYGDDLAVKFYTSDGYAKEKYNWSIMQGDKEIANVNWIYTSQLSNNIVFVQNSTDGVMYNKKGTFAPIFEKFALLNASELTIKLDYIVIDEFCSEITANYEHETSITVTPKTVNLDWTIDEAELNSVQDHIVYNNAIHTVSATIYNADICSVDDTNGTSPQAKISDNKLKYSKIYSVKAEIVGNLNYVISDDNGISPSTIKKVEVKKAKIHISYDYTYDGDLSPQVGKTSLEGLMYVGKQYKITPVFKIEIAPDTFKLLSEADGIDPYSIYTYDLDIKDAKGYTIKYDFSTVKSSSDDKVAVSKSYEFNTNECKFKIGKNIIKDTDITWTEEELTYTAGEQKYLGTYNLVGDDVKTVTTNQVSTEALIIAGSHETKVSFDAESANYELAPNVIKTLLIRKKVVTDIAFNTNTAVYANKSLNNNNSGFNSTAIGVDSLNLIIENATYNAGNVTEFKNVGEYSDVAVALSVTDSANYTFTVYDPANTENNGYTNKLATVQTLSITKYKLLEDNLNKIKEKIYDAGLVEAPKTLTGSYCGETVDFAVTFYKSEIGYGKNVGVVKYSIKMDSATAGNYDASGVESLVSLSYNITPRYVSVNLIDPASIIYSAERQVFDYQLIPQGVNSTACQDEIAQGELDGNKFINFATLNAIQAKDYILIDDHLDSIYTANYKVNNTIFTVHARDITDGKITWGTFKAQYNGSEQGLTGTFSGLGTDKVTVSGTKYMDVKRAGGSYDGEVLAYEYRAGDLTVNNKNYIVTGLPKVLVGDILVGVTFTIEPKTMVYTITDNKLIGNTLTYTYSGVDNRPTFTTPDGANNISINTFMGDEHSTNFTDATVDANNLVIDKKLVMVSASPNYNIVADNKNYAVRINKKEIDLNIPTSVTYNGKENLPASKDFANSALYTGVSGSDNMSVGAHKVNVELTAEYKKNHTIKGSTVGDKSTIIHDYTITQATLDNTNVEYRATQNIGEEFNNMVPLSAVVYNGVSWTIVAKITKDWGTGSPQSVFIYTGVGVNVAQTDYSVGGYKINVAMENNQLYNPTNFDISNYILSGNLEANYNIAQYAVSAKDKLNVFLVGNEDINLVKTSVNPVFNNIVRVPSAEFTPNIPNPTLMKIDTITEESGLVIKDAQNYVLLLSISNTNYVFEVGSDRILFTIDAKTIDASDIPTGDLVWDNNATVQFDNSDKYIFTGNIAIDTLNIKITSNFNANIARKYTNEDYADSNFVLDNNNYKIINISQVFTVLQATIDLANIKWSVNDVETVGELSAVYNHGAMPVITAVYNAFNAIILKFTIVPEVEGQVYNANEGNPDVIYNFIATNTNANFEFNSATSITKAVTITRLNISDPTSITWTLANEEKYNELPASRYTGAAIVPTATIEGVSLKLSADYSSNINANITDPYKVTILAAQDNFNIDSGLLSYTYYILKDSIIAKNIKFENNVSTMPGRNEFTYNESLPIVFVSYIMYNDEKIILNAVDSKEQTDVRPTPYQVTVTLGENANFELAETVIDYYIVPKTITYTWSNLDNQSYLVATLLPSLTISGNAKPQNMTKDLYIVYSNGTTKLVEAGKDLINAGSYKLLYKSKKYNGNSNYKIIDEKADFTINKADISGFDDEMIKLVGKTSVTYTGSAIVMPKLVIAEQNILGGLDYYRVVDGVISIAPIRKIVDVGEYALKVNCNQVIGGNFTGKHTKTFKFFVNAK